METDFTQTSEKYFDDKPENTESLIELQKNAILDRIEQEFNENSLVKRKKIKVKFVYNATYPDGYMIRIVQDHNDPKDVKKKLIFGYHGSVELLTDVLLDIDKEIHLFYDRTMVHVFVAMLMCDDLSKFDKKIRLACLTIEFKCLIDILKPLCKSFTPTTVEKCGLFVSHQGTPFHASTLYNSPTDALPSKPKMERILRKLC